METIQMIDSDILMFIHDNFRNDILTPIFKAITKLGDYGGVFWILIAVVLIIIKRTRRAGLCVSISLAFSGLFTNLIIKNIVARTRPYEILNNLFVLVDKPTDTSFPSGHSSASFAVSVALLIALPLIMNRKKAHWIGFGCILLSAVLCFSRLYLGVHFPTDVLGGMILGTIYGIAGAALGKWLAAKMPSSWFLPVYSDNQD